MNFKNLKFLILAVLMQVFSSTTHAQTMGEFLNRSLWGTAIGAGVGFVTLVASDKPGESWNNVARGASLGLYAGIAYGVYMHNYQPAPQYDSGYVLVPTFAEGKVDGVQLSGTVFSF